MATESAAGQPLRLAVVTPEKAVLDVGADAVTVPMFDGELGVQPGRAALIGRLGAGELRYSADGRTARYFVEAGFVQVRSNVVTVLTAKALPAAEVTTEKVAAATKEADALPSANAVERANKTRALERAQGMRRVAEKNA